MSRPSQAATDRIDRIDPVDHLIGQLYRAEWRPRAGGFREWALQQLQTVISFDGALWGTGTTARWRFHTHTLLGLPAGFPEALEDTRPINPLVPVILARLGTPVDRREVVDDDAWFTSEIHRRCFARFGISQSLSTGHVDHDTGLYSLVTLYRRDRGKPFTSEDKVRQGRLAFHLFNAASHAFFLQLARAHANHPPTSAAAVIDHEGLFHEAQPRFIALLDTHFPERHRSGLPFTPPPPGEIATVNELCVQTEPMGELTCVFAWPTGPLDRLTAREREVVHAVAHGLSFKQAARELGIAPSTVANHLYRVYQKLGLNNRAELARVVHADQDGAASTAAARP